MASNELPTKSQDEFNKLAQIGRGSFGEVFLCEDIKSGERLCMKEIDVSFNSTLERAKCLNEVQLLQHLPAHPNIVGFREAFWVQSEEESAQILCLILEYADDGDLEQFLRSPRSHSMSENEARDVFKQLIQAVSHLHSNGVVHRDLKCGNVFLFTSGRVVLGDFGTAKQLPSNLKSDQDFETQNLTSTVVGSPLYMSPEQLEGELHGFATDIWSLGCVLYELFTDGKPAFAAPSYPAVVYRITQGQFDSLDPALVSCEVINLIASMISKIPHERPTIAEILHSPWLQGTEALDFSTVGCKVSSGVPVPTNTEVARADQIDVAMTALQPITPDAQVLVSPPPAPIDRHHAARSNKDHVPPPPTPIHQALQSSAASPLVQLSCHPARPSWKRLSPASSIPVTYYQRSNHVQSNTPALEIRGVHIRRAARHTQK